MFTTNKPTNLGNTEGKNKAGVQRGFYYTGYEIKKGTSAKGTKWAMLKLNFEKRSNGKDVDYEKSATLFFPRKDNDRDKQEFEQYLTVFMSTFVDMSDISDVEAKTAKEFVEKLLKKLPEDVSKKELELLMVYRKDPYEYEGKKYAMTEVANRVFSGMEGGRFIKLAEEEGELKMKDWFENSKYIKPPVFGNENDDLSFDNQEKEEDDDDWLL